MAARVYGDGRVYHRAGSKNLWIEYWFEGVQYRESTGTDDEGLAKAFLQKRIAEKRAASVGLAEFIGPQRVMLEKLLDNLEDDYRINGRKSLSQLHYHLRTVRRRLGGSERLSLIVFVSVPTSSSDKRKGQKMRRLTESRQPYGEH
jgi:hypothetical protein